MAYDVQNFEEEVLRKSDELPVLVDFWAEWCGPCKMLSPILEKLEAENGGRWSLAKVNTEDFPDIAADYGVQGIPNVKLFSKGSVMAEFVGALPEYAVRQWLLKNVPSASQDKLDGVAAMLADGREEEAAGVLHEILASERQNQRARVLLARALLFKDPAESKRLLEGVDEPTHLELADALRKLQRLVDSADRPGDFPEKSVRARYLSSLEDLRKGQFAKALEGFIEVIREDRFYDDDGSRKACIAIFKFLGEEHPVTQHYRREFSRALYV